MFDLLRPFWSRAAERGAILFLHPFGCTLDERLDRWYLSNTVGQANETVALPVSRVSTGNPAKTVAAHAALP
ncbi:hypothetical protein [Streptomyces sp. DHE17-7]|uniref:hypothetical protein n=1 Tax=Streptomyces sp. DHE17-7 TaxID=2759949 RepID=UPI003FA6B457